MKLADPEYIPLNPTQDFGNHCLESASSLPLKYVSVCRTLIVYQLSIILEYLRSYTILKNVNESTSV